MDFRFVYRRYARPFRHPVRTAHGEWTMREGIYIRLERPDGSFGYGEAAPVPGFGTETVEGVEAECQRLGERVSADQLAALPRNLGALRSAVAAARAPAAPMGERSLGVAALLPAGRAALGDAPAKAEAGFRVFKWKVGVGAADDEMGMLDDLLGVLPAGSKLRLDANGAWNRRVAERWLDRAVDRPIEYVEQPVAPTDRDLLHGLAGDYPVPIALDESVLDEGDVGRWLDEGWTGFFIIKPSLLGDSAAILARLGAADARVVFSSALETGLGARAALGAAFAWRGRPAALGFGVWPLFNDARFDGPAALPFLRAADVERIDAQSLWNALN